MCKSKTEKRDCAASEVRQLHQGREGFLYIRSTRLRECREEVDEFGRAEG